MSEYRKWRISYLEGLSARHGVRGGLAGLIGAGTILAAENHEFIAENTELLYGAGLGSVALGTVSFGCGMYRRTQAARLQRNENDWLDRQEANQYEI